MSEPNIRELGTVVYLDGDELVWEGVCRGDIEAVTELMDSINESLQVLDHLFHIFR